MFWSEIEPRMITFWPCFELTGVATRCLGVSWMELMTRRISSNCAAQSSDKSAELYLLVRPDDEDARTVALSAGVRPSQVSPASAGSMP